MPDEIKEHMFLEVAKWVGAFIAIFAPVGWLFFYFNPPEFLLDPKQIIKIVAIIAYAVLVTVIFIYVKIERKKDDGHGIQN